MKRRVIGFDINTTRVQQLRDGVDVTQEVSLEELAEVSLLFFTTELEDLRECSAFIITVPTPIDQFNFQGQLHSRGRSGQGDRKHPAGCEHCADERAVDDFWPAGH